MGHGREVNTHPQWPGFPLSEQDSPGLFTHRPQTPQRSFQGDAAGTHATSAPNRAHSGSHGETRGLLSRAQRGFVLSAKLPPKEQPANRVCPPRVGGRGLAASRPRWAAQPGRCCFRSRERFSLAVFVPTVSSPDPAAVPVLLETAVRSRGDSYRSAVDSIPPSSAAAPPAPPR